MKKIYVLVFCLCGAIPLQAEGPHDFSKTYFIVFSGSNDVIFKFDAPFVLARLKELGVPSDHITVFEVAPNPKILKAVSGYEDVVVHRATKANLKIILEQHGDMLPEESQLFVYLAMHGESKNGSLSVENDGFLSGQDYDAMIDDSIDPNTQVITFVDSCFSELFLDRKGICDSNDCCFASSAKRQTSFSAPCIEMIRGFPIPASMSQFTRHFFNALVRPGSSLCLVDSFNSAKETLKSKPIIAEREFDFKEYGIKFKIDEIHLPRSITLAQQVVMTKGKDCGERICLGEPILTQAKCGFCEGGTAKITNVYFTQGDLDGDGQVATQKDIVWLKGLLAEEHYSDLRALFVCDLNNDGWVDTQDVTILEAWAADPDLIPNIGYGEIVSGSDVPWVVRKKDIVTQFKQYIKYIRSVSQEKSIVQRKRNFLKAIQVAFGNKILTQVQYDELKQTINVK